MSDVVLSAHEHFEALREGVWQRLSARAGACTRERFDEAYAEWWARELERSAAGRPSHAAAPVAFLAESVHRVLIDEARSRARGLGREEKAQLEVVDLEAVSGAASSASTEAQAGYEALVHRVLTLVQGELSARELRVFVFSFLYLSTSEETAEALGLSVPRVKKDRDRVVRKVGERVWEVLNGELDLCAVYDRKALAAVFEILSVHVEDCPTCRAALGSLRTGALAILPPAQLLLLGGASSEGVTDAVSHAAESLSVRFSSLIHRASETFAAMPAGGRTAAAVAVAASAVAGGAVTVTAPHSHPAKRRHAAAPAPAPASRATAVAARARVTPAASRTPAATPRPARAIAPKAAARGVVAGVREVRRVARERFASAPPAPTATVLTRESVSFEAQASPATASAPAAVPAAVGAPSTPARPRSGNEFDFEHP